VLLAAVASPGITTIDQPLKEMGLAAAEWMLGTVQSRKRGRSQKPRLYKAQPELVVRMSTTRCATKQRIRAGTATQDV
jgi:DNA-binding LacI/PurR family transcriptional regulator